MAVQGAGVAGNQSEAVRQRVEEITGQGPEPVRAISRSRPRAKKVLELSLREALALGHHYIGTEHLLLALLREGQGVAAQVLTGLGAGHAQARERVLGLLTGDCEQTDLQAQLASDLAGAAEQLTQVRQDKEAAFDAGDLEAAWGLRNREKQLLADKLRLENQLTARAAGKPDSRKTSDCAASSSAEGPAPPACSEPAAVPSDPPEGLIRPKRPHVRASATPGAIKDVLATLGRGHVSAAPHGAASLPQDKWHSHKG